MSVSSDAHCQPPSLLLSSLVLPLQVLSLPECHQVLVACHV